MKSGENITKKDIDFIYKLLCNARAMLYVAEGHTQETKNKAPERLLECEVSSKINMASIESVEKFLKLFEEVGDRLVVNDLIKEISQ